MKPTLTTAVALCALATIAGAPPMALGYVDANFDTIFTQLAAGEAATIYDNLRKLGVDLPEAEILALARRAAAARPGETVCDQARTVCVQIER